MVDLRVDEMTCAHCVRAITQAVRSLEPEAKVEIDLSSKRVRVEGRSSSEDVIRALGAAGYVAAPAAEAKVDTSARSGRCGCR